MSNLVQRIYCIISDTEIECDSITPKYSVDGADVVDAMSRDGFPIGHKGGNLKVDLDIEFALPEGSPEIDCLQMLRDREEFPVVIEYDGGRMVQLERCRFTEVEEGGKTGDGVTTKATIKPLRFAVVNPATATA